MSFSIFILLFVLLIDLLLILFSNSSIILSFLNIFVLFFLLINFGEISPNDKLFSSFKLIILFVIFGRLISFI